MSVSNFARSRMARGNNLMRSWTRNVVRYVCLALVLLGVLWVGTSAQPVQMQGAGRGLDLIFALDVSGSMYTDITNSPEVGSNEFGMKALIDNGTDMFATDPRLLRFDATRAILQWLDDFATVQALRYSSFQINATGITFSHEANVFMDWTQVNGYISAGAVSDAADDATPTAGPSAPFFDTPARPPGRQDADFERLYDAVQQALNDPARQGSNNRTVLIIVTDSPPCNSLRSGQTSYCQSGTDRLPSPNSLSGLADLDGHYVFFIRPNRQQAAWEGAYPGLDQAWRDIVGDDLAYRDTIEELPPAMLQVILDEAALALDVDAAGDDEDGGDTSGADPARDYTAMNVHWLNSDQFTVPAYQQRLELLALLPSSNTSMVLSRNGDEIEPTHLEPSDTNLVRQATFLNPAAADWRIALSGGASPAGAVLFWPGRATMTFEPAGSVQYEAFQVVYAIMAERTPLMDTNFLPEVSVDLRTPAGDTHTLELTPNNNRFVATFFPLDAGTYQLDNLRVTLNDPRLSDDYYGFLTPLVFDTFSTVVSPVTIDVAFTDPDQQTRILAREAIPRSEDIPLTLRLLDDGEEILPPGVAAEVSLRTPDSSDTPCPLDGDTFPMDNLATRAVVSLDFDEQGECNVYVSATITSTLAPLNGDEYTILPPTLLDRVIIKNTQILDWSVFDAAAAGAVDLSTAGPHFTMRDLITVSAFTAYADDTLIIPVVIHAEGDENQWVEPEFVGSDGGSIPGSSDNVPFTLSIARVGGEDVENAAEHVALYRSDQPGRYEISISGLPAAQYRLYLSLRDDIIPDTENYEYTADVATEYEVVLAVEHEVLVDVQRILPPVLVVLLVILSVWAGQRAYAVRVNPLSGSLRIYTLPQSTLDDVNRQLANKTYTDLDAPAPTEWKTWEQKLPTRRNEKVFNTPSLRRGTLVPSLGLAQITMTTQGRSEVSARGAARAIVQRRGADDKTLNLEPDVPQKLGKYVPQVAGQVDEMEGNAEHFYIVKLSRGNDVVTQRALFRAEETLEHYLLSHE